jgi:hypothetical protein
MTSGVDDILDTPLIRRFELALAEQPVSVRRTCGYLLGDQRPATLGVSVE